MAYQYSTLVRLVYVMQVYRKQYKLLNDLILLIRINSNRMTEKRSKDE